MALRAEWQPSAARRRQKQQAGVLRTGPVGTQHARSVDPNASLLRALDASTIGLLAVAVCAAEDSMALCRWSVRSVADVRCSNRPQETAASAARTCRTGT